MWHTSDAMHTTNPVFHLWPLKTVHLLLRVIQTSLGGHVKPFARSFRFERVPVQRRCSVNTSTALKHIVGETLLGASIAVFPHSLVSIRLSSAYCILSLKTARVDLLMRGF